MINIMNNVIRMIIEIQLYVWKNKIEKEKLKMKI